MARVHDRPFDAALLSGSYSVSDGRHLKIAILPMWPFGYRVVVVQGDITMRRSFLLDQKAVAWANDEWDRRIDTFIPPQTPRVL